jgi:hypothetical protein
MNELQLTCQLNADDSLQVEVDDRRVLFTIVSDGVESYISLSPLQAQQLSALLAR